MTDTTHGRIRDLFREHAARMRAAARSVLRSEADAEDVVQEVLVTLLRAPHLLFGIERIGAWLYTVVRRRCIDLIRRRERRRREESEAARNGPADDPADLAEENEAARATARAIRELPADLCLAFVETAVKGRTFREVSAATGVPMGTLLARKQRAAALLRDALRRQRLWD